MILDKYLQAKQEYNSCP